MTKNRTGNESGNRLIHESSPYLRQHAHNPVDWYPWGDEAIQKAREEDKPMLVSIGYSACHWCHVMERESFEDPETAELMNREFVNIKIDREERPDLDHIYMEAVQAIAGNGGWPLNVFLTPEAKPFYGGTYFPPVTMRNHPSWKSVLESIAVAFREKRSEIEEQATHLTNHIAGSGFGMKLSADTADFTPTDTTEIFEQLMKTADQTDGGFGAAPKFPQTFSIRFLLQYHYYSTNNAAGSSRALDQACLSLDKMIFGGIYDQLGGGFARYSTDSVWLAPHFEKMLYDNALLITTLSEAFQIVQAPHYKRAIVETINFTLRELKSSEGGFYSALDADSEGEEGKYYIWQKNDIDNILGVDSPLFCSFFDVTEGGNWEGKNILRILKPGMLEENSKSGENVGITPEKLSKWKRKLLEVRQNRVRPQLDDKILLGWNALMISAFCKAYAALGDISYRETAIDTINFLEKKMKGQGVFHFYHSYKDGKASIPGFLDDYAYLIEAYILLQEVTGDTEYLIRAELLTDWVIQHFGEAETGYFYYTHASQDDVIVRKREVYDGAIPSGNAVMSTNLLYIGTVFDRKDWKERALENTRGLKDVLRKYSGSFGIWATLLNALTYQLYEIVLGGDERALKLPEFLSEYIPNRVFQCSSAPHENLPLLKNKPVKGLSQFFLCRDYTCQKPVKEVIELIPLLKNS